MAKQTETAEPKRPVAAAGGDSSLDEIREILFGVQARKSEERFERTEKRIVDETLILRQDVRARFERLETFLNDELAKTAERITSERTARIAELSKLSDDLRSLIRETALLLKDSAVDRRSFGELLQDLGARLVQGGADVPKEVAPLKKVG
jgi:hypothetical protein